jgi:hypothetical protein
MVDFVRPRTTARTTARTTRGTEQKLRNLPNRGRFVQGEESNKPEGLLEGACVATGATRDEKTKIAEQPHSRQREGQNEQRAEQGVA